MRWTVYILAAAGTAQALSLPFRLPSWLWFGSRSNALTIDSGKPWYNASKTVAIIGAGAGGSSAAFFIAKAKKRYGVDIDIHLYDRNEFVGGGESLSRPLALENSTLPKTMMLSILMTTDATGLLSWACPTTMKQTKT
jgi:prenylcysteine oxidase/farnesylcysteine lyase